MTKPLLIEIGVEELPAIPFLKELPNIEKKWMDILEKYSLISDFEFFYTPRRLVLWHREFKIKQDDSIVEQFGAPLHIAYKDNQPTNAALGFAKKCNTSVESLSSIQTPKGEVLYFKQEISGKPSSQLLNDMINEFIRNLKFGKSMRWGNLQESFIRPIRSLCVMLEEELIDAKLFEVASSKEAYGHRMVSPQPFTFELAGDYFSQLQNHGVVLYPTKRKEMILEQMKALEAQHQISIEIDESLLDEIVAITEYPTALLGSFDELFLQLPEEVIVTSMKEHQRYFPVYKNKKLSNHFIVVSNAKTDDFSLIIQGNEKVLRPRLADAMFFYQNDLNNGLNNEALKTLVFVEGLGSMYDKCQREVLIAQLLGQTFNEEQHELLQRAVMLSKADLCSEMVYEFTELQGLMGYYYAKAANEQKEIYTALKEQYLPDGEDSQLPSTLFSSIVALANKIDNLMALFSVGKIPTGSKDPYALRRAALGIVKIAIEHKLPLNFEAIVSSLSVNYPNLEQKSLNEFFQERLFKIFDVNPSVLKAVLNSGEKDIYKISQKVSALNPIVLSSDFKEYSATFKRVANIIKELDTDETLDINSDLFVEKQESALYEAYKNVTSKSYDSYDEELDALFGLKPQLDAFFDGVFVNDENLNIRQNRKNLIGLIYQAFKKIADIKEISI
jgi:glycyl-tRNA synthetase beta chain